MTSEPTTDADISRVVIDCADEPIRIPGSVQPHGALLAVVAGTTRVVVASWSVREHLGRDAEDVVGVALEELFGASWPEEGLAALDAVEPRTVDVDLPDGGRRSFDLLAHASDDLVLLELEPRRPVPADQSVRARAALRGLQAAGAEDALTAELARAVRAVTGFDRVMVYRFDAAWNGTVVAEDAAPDLGLDPYLGLRFPASDIPAQARALYTSQWLRSIPDARYTPSPLVPPLRPSGEPVDLSDSALRSVSPVHLEYLANMGVEASMSVSLITRGVLWGLVACHHYRGPHFPTAGQRGTAEFLGRTASVLLEGWQNRNQYLDSLALTATAGDLARLVTAHDRRPVAALTGDDAVLDLVDGAAGAAVRLQGRTALVGRTPALEDVTALLAELWADRTRTTVVSDALGTALPGSDVAARVRDTVSGILAVPVASGAPDDALVWFKPEVLTEVRWAGDPTEKGLEETPDGLRLTPRASFATYVEQVRGTSTPWNPLEVAAAEQLAVTVGEVLVRRSAEDARLAGALQQIVLTTRPPTPAGYALASRYTPSGQDVVGGDWFDVTALPDGRLVVMIGDVAGHGIGKAAITAQLRNALRAYLVDTGSVAEAIARLGRLVAELVPGELATIGAVELDPATGRLVAASAGHLPALVRRAAGAELLDGARGPALGLGLAAELDVHETTLGSGDSVVLFTDGLVEQRGTAMSASLRALVANAEAAPPDADGLVDALLAGAPRSDDDVTLVALHRIG
ncbi:SpoIIE family protein phosphatase [Cellulomonas carbonis]|uniref:Histidine kinase n=1 Tax=Cellulomonas carbonis T26 TaxID=947969 RepID=A0A0A0BJT1_9CELL|nr:SpoIIE family protein phosphatase [Cellulomonas carbonis]KGM08743.1 histidine kinase [Cellulomonas carbonis T26]GGC17240.1 hypothetical protein GCM10010972_33150 [Cellulomonas carbonis]